VSRMFERMKLSHFYRRYLRAAEKISHPWVKQQVKLGIRDQFKRLPPLGVSVPSSLPYDTRILMWRNLLNLQHKVCQANFKLSKLRK
jgi:hypothetical protein